MLSFDLSLFLFPRSVLNVRFIIYFWALYKKGLQWILLRQPDITSAKLGESAVGCLKGGFASSCLGRSN